MTRHYGRRPVARHLAAPTGRERFVAAYAAAGVPAREATALFAAVTRLGRRRNAGQVTEAQVRAWTNQMSRPLLARYATVAS